MWCWCQWLVVKMGLRNDSKETDDSGERRKKEFSKVTVDDNRFDQVSPNPKKVVKNAQLGCIR